MDEKGKCILTEDCVVEIMKYIISDCELNSEAIISEYDDFINFVLADEFFFEILRDYFKRLYEKLEFSLKGRITKLLIDLRLNKLSNKSKEFFWRSHLHALREKVTISDVGLIFDPDKNASQRVHVKISIYGISKGLEHFDMLTVAKKIPAEALVDICIATPTLKRLTIESTTIIGALPDIPYFDNVEEIRIRLSPKCSANQYAPLAKLPNLRKLIISGIIPSTSTWLIFNDVMRWNRPETLTPLAVTIEGCLTDLRRTVVFANIDSLQYLNIYESFDDHSCVLIEAKYNLCKISKDPILKEKSLATFILGKNVQIVFDRNKGELEIMVPQTESDMAEFASLLKLPNLTHLVITQKRNNTKNLTRPGPIILENLFCSDDPVPLTSFVLEKGSIDRSGAEKLAKLKTIRHLSCSFSDWESIEFLNQLTNLQFVEIKVPWSKADASGICNLLNICQVTSVIIFEQFHLRYKRKDQILEVHIIYGCTDDMITPLAQLNGVKTLLISGNRDYRCPEPVNALFDDFGKNNLSGIEDLDISQLKIIQFKDIFNVTKMQTIRKLKCSISNLIGIEKLAELKRLEELEITRIGNSSLSPLFTKLATENKITSLQIHLEKLSPEEVLKVSEIRSLKKFGCGFFDLEEIQSLSELSHSNIEELTIFGFHQNHSLLKLFSTFALNGKSKIQHLQIIDQKLTNTELYEISKIKGLKVLAAKFFEGCIDDCVAARLLNIFFSKPLELPLLSSIQKLDVKVWIGFKECTYLAQLESLESLKCSLCDDTDSGLEVLANIKNLRELIIDDTAGSLCKLYRTFSRKPVSVLQKLHTVVSNSDEIGEISQIKSLIKLSISCKIGFYNLRIADLVQLKELESLNIVNSNINSELDYQSVPPIFKFCKKLNFATFKFDNIAATKFVYEAYNILKSVRDPGLQAPLQLTLVEDYPEFHEEDIDEAYLKVSYSCTITKFK